MGRPWRAKSRIWLDLNWFSVSSVWWLCGHGWRPETEPKTLVSFMGEVRCRAQCKQILLKWEMKPRVHADFLMKYYSQFPKAHVSIFLRLYQMLSSSDILFLPFDSYHQPPFTISGTYPGELMRCVCARPHLRWVGSDGWLEGAETQYSLLNKQGKHHGVLGWGGVVCS